MKSHEQLCREILADKALRDALQEAERNGTVAQFLAGQGVEADERAFTRAMHSMFAANGAALSDNDMAKTVGGVRKGKLGRASSPDKVVFEFRDGQRVVLWWWGLMCHGKIVSHYAKAILGDYYPYYKVRYDGYCDLYDQAQKDIEWL